MRYLAGSAVNISVWSADPLSVTDGQGPQTNFFVRSHQQASVARLLQYIHWQLYQRCDGQIEPIQHFCMRFQGRTLDLEQLVKDIDPSAVGAVTLKMEYTTQQSGPAINLDYDSSEDFSYTNVEFQLNVLSTDKVISRMELKIPWNHTLAKLKKSAVSILNDYEMQNSRNICSSRQHTPEDLIGFDLLGRSHPISLDIDDSNNDLQLCDLMGLDFAPSTAGSCCIMFRIKHVQDSEDGVIIRFVSDAQLTMDHMTVQPESTVQDVKDFICSVYGHALRLTPADVRLIYKGQLLRDTKSSGELSKVLDYVSESRGAKVHVHINQEYTEPGPGFWNELFNNNDRFSFMNRSSSENTENTQNTPVADVAPEINTTQTSAEIPNLSSSQNSYFTESGTQIERTGQIYEKVLISGQESFIQSTLFEPTQTFLELNDQQVEVFPDEFVELQGVVLLSQRAISRIENLVGIKVANTINSAASWTNVSSSHLSSTSTAVNDSPDRADDLDVEEVGRLARVRQWTRAIMRTIYLILRNSVFFLVIFFQVASYVKPTYLFLAVVLIVLKAIWSTPEIWEMWRELLWKEQEGKISDEELSNLTNLLNESELSRQFYNRFASKLTVIEALIERLQENNELRLCLIDRFKLDAQDSLQIMVPKLLEECISTQHDEANLAPLRELFDPLLKDVMDHFRDTSGQSRASREVLTELRKYSYQQSKLPWHRNCLRRIAQLYTNLYSGGLVRGLVPRNRGHPRGLRFLLRALGDILKLMALFLLTLIPRFQRQAVREANRVAASARHRD
ncbi:LANO_0H12068g1_1 [Lachancea nothofagi CBS 11611]|uniref:LANO_0H12068g1_1 n=1 Tax=Lachancea nothofagi CBS 11611 TaxID=1266666 RepID=A0A1G4KM45_9SACH|nr:LANO_0H12068g1_1 [Lachancea nothofagi CBS 11611]